MTLEGARICRETRLLGWNGMFLERPSLPYMLLLSKHREMRRTRTHQIVIEQRRELFALIQCSLPGEDSRFVRASWVAAPKICQRLCYKYW